MHCPNDSTGVHPSTTCGHSTEAFTRAFRNLEKQGRHLGWKDGPLGKLLCLYCHQNLQARESEDAHVIVGDNFGDPRVGTPWRIYLVDFGRGYPTGRVEDATYYPTKEAAESRRLEKLKDNTRGFGPAWSFSIRPFRECLEAQRRLVGST